jgi:hypothetical protein
VKDDTLQCKSLVLWLGFNPCTYRVQARSFYINPSCSVMSVFASGRCEVLTFVYVAYLFNEDETFRDSLHQFLKQMTVFLMEGIQFC